MSNKHNTIYLSFTDDEEENLIKDLEEIAKTGKNLFGDFHEVDFITDSKHGIVPAEMLNESYNEEKSETIFSIPAPLKAKNYLENRSFAIKLKFLFSKYEKYSPHFTTYAFNKELQ